MDIVWRDSESMDIVWRDSKSTRREQNSNELEERGDWKDGVNDVLSL